MSSPIKAFASLSLLLPVVLGSTTAQCADGKGLIKGIIGVGVTAIILNEMSKSERGTWDRSRRRTRGETVQGSAEVRRNKAIQQSLNKLGYDVGTVDGIMGSRSRAEIVKWQIDIGNEGTGMLTAEQYGQLTGQSADSPHSAPPGAANNSIPNENHLTDQDVRLLQTSLDRLGYSVGSIDGTMGQSTRLAVVQFLRDRGDDPNTTPLNSVLRKATELAGVEYHPADTNLNEVSALPNMPTTSLSDKDRPVSSSPSENRSLESNVLDNEISDLEKQILELKKLSQSMP